RDAAECCGLTYAETARGIDDGGRDGRPAQRRFGSAHDDDVAPCALAAPTDAAPLERDARPVDHSRRALPAGDRTGLLEVREHRDVDRREDVAVCELLGQCG